MCTMRTIKIPWHLEIVRSRPNKAAVRAKFKITTQYVETLTLKRVPTKSACGYQMVGDTSYRKTVNTQKSFDVADSP